MKFGSVMFVVALSVLSIEGTTAQPASYAGQEQRQIKALSESEIDGLLAGRGMGYARAAELNGYPGPMHVLELGTELQLNPEQRAASQALFDEMLAAAQQLGAQLVEAERALDQRFISKDIDEASLTELTATIGAIQARLRAVHLRAHLRQTQLLSDDQIERYMGLRGYRHNQRSHHHHNHNHNH